MEIIDSNRLPDPPRRHRDRRGSNIYLGVLLMIAGIVWLLYNLDIIGYDTFNFVFSWEMGLTAVGGFLLSARRWISGGIVTGLGIVALIVSFCNFDLSFSRIVLPVLVIASGIAIILSRLER